MAEFDLIPPEYVQHRDLLRRVKLFALMLAGLLVAVALARVVIDGRVRALDSEVAQLRLHDQASNESKVKAEALRVQKAAAERRLAELDELRGSDRLRLLLGGLDAAYVEGVWLDGIRYYRSDKLPTDNLNALPGAANSGIIVVPRENVPVPGAAPPIPGIEQHVEMVGHALSHTLVAELMRALGAQRGIVGVRLLDTSERTYTSTSVIDFKLTLLIDDRAGSKQ